MKKTKDITISSKTLKRTSATLPDKSDAEIDLEFYRQILQEGKSAHKEAHDAIAEAMEYYVGNIFTEDQKRIMLAEGKPPLEINLTQKPVNSVVGYYAQMMGDLRAFPQQGGDAATADVLSEALKWNITQFDGQDEFIAAVLDSVIGGLGCVFCYLDYDFDPIDGDLRFIQIDPKSVLFDPATKRIDWTDCGYVIYRNFIEKDLLKGEFEDFIDEIDEVKPSHGNDSDFGMFGVDNPRKDNSYLMVDEIYYRKYRKVMALAAPVEMGMDGMPVVDPETGEAPEREIIVLEYNKAAMKEMAAQGFDVLSVKTTKIIHRMVVIEEQTVVYNEPYDESPHHYPIVPAFFLFTPTASTWRDRYQGLERSLAPLNDEECKRRSQMLAAALTQPFGVTYIEEGMTNLDDFVTKTAAGWFVKYRGNPPIPGRSDFSALSALQQLSMNTRNDMREVGPNPDFLGMVGSQGGSGPSAPGITVSMRQQQATVTLQLSYRNLTRAHRQLGRVALSIMQNNWSTDKFRKICDREIPQNFDKSRYDAVYDVIVDETTGSKTFQFATFSQIMQLEQMGIAVPQQLKIKYSGIPAQDAQEILDYNAQMMQAQQMTQGMPPGMPPGMPQGPGGQPPENTPQ